MHEQLSKQLRLYIDPSPEAESFFHSLFRVRKLKRRQQLLQEGDVYTHSSYVVSGILRLYAIDKNGFEHIIQFAPSGWWIGDMNSLLHQQPGNLYIDAVEDSELLQISRQELEILLQRYPEFESYFRRLAENAVAAYQQRILSILSLPARERHLQFLQLYPNLAPRLPQKYIASYIGVTPEFLSKLLSQPASAK